MIPTSVLMRMAVLGLTAEQAAEVADMLATVEAATKEEAGASIEARRKSDREHKQRQRHGMSRDVAGQDVTGRDNPTPDKERSPTPPKEINPTPSSLRSDKHQARADEARTPKSELEAVLDAEHVAAVLDHRQRIRKPLTAHAAKLLAGKFARCPDPNAAADAMVSNGWQGFEPEWMENRAGSRQQPRSPPPRREKTILDVIDERLEQQNAERTFDTSRTIEHEPGGGASPVVRFPADTARYGR